MLNAITHPRIAERTAARFAEAGAGTSSSTTCRCWWKTIWRRIATSFSWCMRRWTCGSSVWWRAVASTRPMRAVASPRNLRRRWLAAADVVIDNLNRQALITQVDKIGAPVWCP